MPTRPTPEKGRARAAPAATAKVRRDAVRDMLAEVDRQIEAIPAAELRALWPVLRHAREQVEGALRGWLKDVPDGRARFTAQHLRNVLANLNRAMRRMADMDGVANAMEGVLERSGKRAGALAVAHVERELRTFEALFEGSIRPIALPQAAILAHGRETQMVRHRTSAYRYAGQVGKDIRLQLATGLARNETVYQMIQRLVGHGGPRGRVALRGVLGEPGAYVQYIGEGLFKRYGHWAERLVRTETMGAYSLASERSIAAAAPEHPGLVMRWDASVDRRVCVVCRELHGKTAKVGGEFAGGYGRPPAHPHCRCVLLPWRPEWKGDF